MRIFHRNGVTIKVLEHWALRLRENQFPYRALDTLVLMDVQPREREDEGTAMLHELNRYIGCTAFEWCDATINLEPLAADNTNKAAFIDTHYQSKLMMTKPEGWTWNDQIRWLARDALNRIRRNLR